MFFPSSCCLCTSCTSRSCSCSKQHLSTGVEWEAFVKGQGMWQKCHYQLSSLCPSIATDPVLPKMYVPVILPSDFVILCILVVCKLDCCLEGVTLGASISLWWLKGEIFSVKVFPVKTFLPNMLIMMGVLYLCNIEVIPFVDVQVCIHVTEIWWLCMQLVTVGKLLMCWCTSAIVASSILFLDTHPVG